MEILKEIVKMNEMKVIFVVVALILFCGCVQENAEDIEKEVMAKVKYKYPVQNDYDLVTCGFQIPSNRDVFLHVLSLDNSTISMGIFNEKDFGIEFSKDQPGMVALTNGEMSVSQEGYEYFGYESLEAGDYLLYVSQPGAENISVLIESSEEMECW